MRHTLLIALLCGYLVGSLTAQADSTRLLKNINNSIAINIGWHQVKDENLHRKVHEGVQYGLAYSHLRTAKNRGQISSQLQYARLRTEYEPMPASTSVQLYLQGNYAWRCLEAETYQLYLGASAVAQYRFYSFPNWDESHVYWADDISLGLSSYFDWQIADKRQLMVTFQASLLSLFSRPAAYRHQKIDDLSFGGVLSNMHSNWDIGTLNKAIGLHFKLEYQIELSAQLTQAFSYTARYHRLEGNNSAAWQQIEHNVGIQLYF